MRRDHRSAALVAAGRRRQARLGVFAFWGAEAPGCNRRGVICFISALQSKKLFAEQLTGAIHIDAMDSPHPEIGGLIHKPATLIGIGRRRVKGRTFRDRPSVNVVAVMIGSSLVCGSLARWFSYNRMVCRQSPPLAVSETPALVVAPTSHVDWPAPERLESI